MTSDNNDDALADDWAQALQEQSANHTDQGFASGAPHFDGDLPPNPTGTNDISMVLDIPVQLSVELGRTKVPIKYILQLAQGSIVELDALAGEPMDVLVNGYLIAQGEVVVVNEKFGIRLTDIVTPSERLRRLSKH
jgi:flagellar motor switch protein FliN